MSRLNIEEACREQWVTLWGKSSTDNEGRVTVSSPVQFKCRWEENQRVIVGEDGRPIAVDADVVVDRVISVLSILRLGKISEIPTPINNLMQVVFRSETPDIKNKYTRKIVSVSRYTDTLPTVES